MNKQICKIYVCVYICICMYMAQGSIACLIISPSMWNKTSSQPASSLLTRRGGAPLYYTYNKEPPKNKNCIGKYSFISPTAVQTLGKFVVTSFLRMCTICRRFYWFRLADSAQRSQSLTRHAVKLWFLNPKPRTRKGLVTQVWKRCWFQVGFREHRSLHCLLELFA